MLDRFIRSKASSRVIQTEAAPEQKRCDEALKTDVHNETNNQDDFAASCLDALFSEMLVEQPVLGIKV